MLYLSAIMPMFNSENYLEKTLNSVVRLVGNFSDEIEILLIDDGSNDNTVKIAQKYVQKFPCFKLFKKEHEGVSVARNYGMERAHGKYITFIDSDDTYSSQFYLKIKSILLLKPDIIITDVKSISKNMILDRFTKDQKIKILRIINNKSGGEGISSKIYRLSFLKKYHIKFNTNLKIGEDAIFLYTAILYAKKAVMSSIDFYFVGLSHTLGEFNPNLLNNEKLFLYLLSQISIEYKDSSNYFEILEIENRYRVKSYFRIIETYYGPLVSSKKMTLKNATEELKKYAQTLNIKNALKHNPYKHLYSKRRKIYDFLTRLNEYECIILLERLIEKSKA